MLDADLAGLYQVPTKVFNQAVKRHRARFPEDFMFRLTLKEAGGMRSQFVTAYDQPLTGKRNSRFQPYAFTEHGVAMLSAVLNSPRAIRMNISIIRAFIRLREAAVTNAGFARRIEKLETSQEQHASVIIDLAEEIEELKGLPPEPPRRRIGF